MKVGIKLEFEPEVLKRIAAKAKIEKITPVELMKEHIKKTNRPVSATARTSSSATTGTHI